MASGIQAHQGGFYGRKVLSGNEKTDPSRWRLVVNGGRQFWEYVSLNEAAKNPQSIAEKYFLGLQTGLPASPKAKDAKYAAIKCYDFFEKLQLQDGHWGCEYGGPMFLLPGLVIAMYVTKTPIPEEWAIEIVRYLLSLQREDGGWGIHMEADSSCFGTVMNYVTLRILGLSRDHPCILNARKRLLQLGSALAIPSWGKFWLSILNCYAWEGMNPIPPELWLLPRWFLFHPWRWWVHTRAVYIPMGYCYGRKLSCRADQLILRLREELYDQPFDNIDWSKQRNNVSKADLYRPHSTIFNLLNSLLSAYFKYIRPEFVAKLASKESYRLIHEEDVLSHYLCVGPVNNVIHLICSYYEEGEFSDSFRNHQERLKDFLWISSRGLMMNGTNGVQLWDTAFTVQALVESGLAQMPEYRKSLTKAYEFLDFTQIKRECSPSAYYRQKRLGAWPFSTIEQGYTVSDCTAEGLKAALQIHQMNIITRKISDARIFFAVDILLSMQNSNGGYASYELVRGSSFLEKLNPSEVFGKIMIEYPYVECTTSVITALCMFQKQYPSFQPEKINKTISKAVNFVRKEQRVDGSWVGSWGIGFTYASMFATECLSMVGETFENSIYQRNACKFLLDKQEADGGWGETFKSCELEEYTHNEKSQVVNTAWAVISLINAQYPFIRPIKRGIDLILSRQRLEGDFAQESIEGVFNGNCMISYPNYKFYFVIKAFGMFASYEARSK